MTAAKPGARRAAAVEAVATSPHLADNIGPLASRLRHAYSELGALGLIAASIVEARGVALDELAPQQIAEESFRMAAIHLHNEHGLTADVECADVDVGGLSQFQAVGRLVLTMVHRHMLRQQPGRLLDESEVIGETQRLAALELLTQLATLEEAAMRKRLRVIEGGRP